MIKRKSKSKKCKCSCPSTRRSRDDVENISSAKWDYFMLNDKARHSGSTGYQIKTSSGWVDVKIR